MDNLEKLEERINKIEEKINGKIETPKEIIKKKSFWKEVLISTIISFTVTFVLCLIGYFIWDEELRKDNSVNIPIFSIEISKTLILFYLGTSISGAFVTYEGRREKNK